MSEKIFLTDIEKKLKERFDGTTRGVPSTAHEPARSERVDTLVLPLEKRPKMPITKDKFLVKENPHMVAWERIVREFLRKLPLAHGHRVSAAMIYEWATGINIAELQDQGGSANRELRYLNKILRHYFGKSYTTYIMGRKVANAYRVSKGFMIVRKRPLMLELVLEYTNGTLVP